VLRSACTLINLMVGRQVSKLDHLVTVQHMAIYTHRPKSGYINPSMISTQTIKGGGAAAWSSGLACLSFALRVRGSNSGVDTGEKGKKGTNHLSPFFELYRISLVH
jgi:hypothetical protein